MRKDRPEYFNFHWNKEKLNKQIVKRRHEEDKGRYKEKKNKGK